MPRTELKKPTVLTINGKTEELMVTAVVNVLDHNKKHIRCRALIDTGATSNFITIKLANILNLQKRKYNVPVQGLGDAVTSTSHIITATIQSRLNNFEKTLSFLTVNKIVDQHPASQIDRAYIKIPANIKLADPTFHIPSEVDMIIGAGPALSLLCVGQTSISTQGGTELILQKNPVRMDNWGKCSDNKIRTAARAVQFKRDTSAAAIVKVLEHRRRTKTEAFLYRRARV